MDEEWFRKARVMLARDEGEKRWLYDDKTGASVREFPSGGKPTIGIGRNLGAKPLSQAVVDLMFQEDANEAEQACLLIFGEERWEEWPENRCLGWLNFVFNLGHATAITFKRTLRAAFRDDWAEVEVGLKGSLWAEQVGSRSDRVVAMVCRAEWPY